MPLTCHSRLDNKGNFFRKMKLYFLQNPGIEEHLLEVRE
jgi:hypothetical protein